MRCSPRRPAPSERPGRPRADRDAQVAAPRADRDHSVPGCTTTPLSNSDPRISGFTHALAEPLLLAQVHVQRLRDRLGDDGDLDALAATVDRIRVLNDGLLRLAAAEAEPVRDVLALDDVVRASLRRAGTNRDISGLRLQASALPAAHADEILVTALVAELIANAADHAGPTALLAITPAPAPAGHVAIAFQDDGPGLNGADPALALAPFRRARRDAPASGAGVGLAVAERIAAAHGGSISLQPASLGGLNVTVVLPAGS